MTEWRRRYKAYLENYLQPYQERQSEHQTPASAQSTLRNSGEMELLFGEDAPTISTQPKTSFHDELTQYLNSGM